MPVIRSALPVLILLLAGCEQATLPLRAGTGPNPADGLTPLTPDWLADRLRPATDRQEAAA